MLGTSRLVLLAVAVGGIAFTALAVVRPLRAVQLFLVLTMSAIANPIEQSIGGVLFSGGSLLVVFVLFGWMLSGSQLGDERMRRLVGPILVIVLTFLIFELWGAIHHTGGRIAQIDLIPVIFLVSFFPMLGVMETEREVRAVFLSVLVGLALLGLLIVYQYVTNFDVESNYVPIWFGRLGRQGLAGGARVIPEFHRGALLPIGVLASIALARGRGGDGIRRSAAVVIGGLCGLGLLVMYYRSLLIMTGVALAVMLVFLAPDPGRALRSLLVLAAVVAGLMVSVPVLTGQPLGSTISGIGERFSDVTDDPSVTTREEENSAALERFGAAPILGEGLGAAFFHNVYLGMLVKTGLVGTTLYVGMLLLITVRAGRRAARETGFARTVLAVSTAWMLGIMVASNTSAFVLAHAGFQLVALVAALTAFYEHRAAQAPREEAVETVAPAPAPVPL
jgi:O-antigen ligase